MRERLHVLERRGWQDPVSQIEDVAASTSRPCEHIVGGGENTIDRSQEERGIQIALNSTIGSDAIPGFVKWRAPVGANDGSACVAQVTEYRPCPYTEMNGGGVVRGERVEDPFGVGQDEFAVIVRVQGTHPRIEHLHG